MTQATVILIGVCGGLLTFCGINFIANRFNNLIAHFKVKADHERMRLKNEELNAKRAAYWKRKALKEENREKNSGYRFAGLQLECSCVEEKTWNGRIDVLADDCDYCERMRKLCSNRA